MNTKLRLCVGWLLAFFASALLAADRTYQNAGGFKAVALVNRSPIAREIRLTFKEIGLGGVCYVKDLWRQKCEGNHVGCYTALVPPHATKLVKTRPVDCEKCE